MNVVLGVDYKQWPKRHRKAFEAARTTPDSASSCEGRAAHWRPDTCLSVKFAWGLLLGYDRRCGQLQDDRAPGTVLPEELEGFIRDLLARGVRYSTVATYVRHLAEAVRVMLPGAEYKFIATAAIELQRAATLLPDGKTGLVGASTVYAAMLARMDKAMDGSLSSWKDALAYLDGLKVAIDDLTNVRLKTLALTEQRHFTLENGIYTLTYDRTEMKTKKPFKGPLPAALTPYIDHGFAVAAWLIQRSEKGAGSARPLDVIDPAPPSPSAATGGRICKSRVAPNQGGQVEIPVQQPLWVTRSGVRMSRRQTHARIKNTTWLEVGVELGPQQLRRLGPTSLRRFVPWRSSLAVSSVQHHSSRMTQKYVKCDGSSSAFEFHRLLMDKFGKKPNE